MLLCQFGFYKEGRCLVLVSVYGRGCVRVVQEFIFLLVLLFFIFVGCKGLLRNAPFVIWVEL